VVVPAHDLAQYLDPLSVAGLVPALRPGAECKISVGPSDTDSDMSVISTAFLLSGLHTTSERREEDGTRVFTAVKNKSSAAGQAEAKRINVQKPIEEEKKTDETTNVQKATIRLSAKVMLDDLDDDEFDDDLIDEDGLLDDDGGGFLAPPPVPDVNPSKTDDCGGRKACDNCSCGRAEQEAAAKKGDDVPPLKQAPSSSCGNCSKGDAFRCAGCPYLGKPAFKEGEEHLVLDLADDF